MIDHSPLRRRHAPRRRRVPYLPFLLILLLAALPGAAHARLPAPHLRLLNNPCAGAEAGDGLIVSAEIYHDNTDPDYRDPIGSIEPDGSAIVRLRTCQGDVEEVDVLVWLTDAGPIPTHEYPAAVASSDGVYDIWQYEVPGPDAVIDQWYQFRVTDGAAVGHYHSASGNSGPGEWVDSASPVDPSWSLPTTPTPPADYPVPDWIQDAVIYQIFPDRFRNGDPANDPVDGAPVYEPDGCEGYPHERPGGATSGCLHDLRDWNAPLLVPSWGLDFYGGDLQGVIDKIDEGYFNDLGVNTLYFNPIFDSSSNHGYDTNDYHSVRSYFGDNALFDALVAAADAHGLRIILDAVFNHGGMDSKYLDPYNRWPNPPTLEYGACEAAGSPFRPWLTPGNAGSDVCDGGWGWLGWHGYSTLPEFIDAAPGVRDLFFRGGAPDSPGGQSVSQFWQAKGVAGWRYDVAQDITHDFFSEMRPYVKGDNASGPVYGDSQILMLGEVTGGCDWGLYQSYLNENELDSVMNYCFRDWARGFADGDAPSSFDSAYNAFRARFPESAWQAMMNLISSHDSPRMLSLLNQDKSKLKLVVLLQMTLPGAPSVYYGDEVGLPGSGDPDNRRVYPWADTGGGMNGDPADLDMRDHFKQVIGIRQAHSALRGGDIQTLLTDDDNRLYSYIRWDSSQKIVVALNNSADDKTAVIPVAAHLADGALLTDLLNGGVYTVSGGSIVAPVAGRWGVILAADAVAGDYVLDVTIDPAASGGAVALNPPPGSDGKYVAGTVVALTASPAQDYDCGDPYWTFDHWSGDAGGSDPVATVVMESDRSVAAHFVPVAPPPCPRYALATTVDPPDSGGAVALDPPPGADGRYDAGTVVALTASPAQDYDCGDPYWTFDHWSGDAGGSDPVATVVMESDRSVAAHFAPVAPPPCLDPPLLDGWRDASYGQPIATDPADDLARPGPGDWPGTHWTDLTALYCLSVGEALYVYADLPAYAQAVSSGQMGLLINIGQGLAGGGSDPWGGAIAFAHADLPDAVVRGNIPGIAGNPPDANNGWTELRRWSGSAWSGAGVNWGGIAAGGQVGDRIAYADGQGVEWLIPRAEIGAEPEDAISLELFTTQSGASKGAYDTAPSDDQSGGWDDPTTLSVWANCAPADPRYALATTVDPPDSGGAVALDPPPGADGRYDAGTVVTLTASPAQDYDCGDPYWTFDHWSGDAGGSDPVTTVLMESDRSVAAHFVPVTPPPCLDPPLLDGWRDASYGQPIATDPADDLVRPGSSNWPGTHWTDLTALYCLSVGEALYVYADLPAYAQAVSSGQMGLLINIGQGLAGGGSDPWGGAIAFAHADLPDAVVRGNIPGIAGNPPDANNGWTELRRWSGSAWSGAGVNWGGIAAGGQVGDRIAYADGQGVEWLIPRAEIGAEPEDAISLELFTTQSGASKGAYDTAPSDDQSGGWDDPTTLSVWANCAPVAPVSP